jgi:hypothetical protein
MGIGTLFGLFFAITLLVVLLKRNRKPEVPAKSERSELDAWIEDTIAREAAKKAKLETEELMAALQGDPDPHVVSAVEEAVRAVKLTFAKMPREGEYEIRAEIAFEDGTSTTRSKLLTPTGLSTEIRDEFARTGGSYVFREWHFPWYR